jgi:class 3 adenylate cyclase
MKEIDERLSATAPKENFTQQLLNRGSVFDTILPPDVQTKLASGERIPPVSYDDVTVIFSDIVGFTGLCTTLTAEEVGDLISRLMRQFDIIGREHGIKTLDVIGDAFLGVSGVPDSVENHASKAALFALSAIEAASATLVSPRNPDLGYVKVRFGLASGPVVATVVGGAEHPKYTLYVDCTLSSGRIAFAACIMSNMCLSFL